MVENRDPNSDKCEDKENLINELLNVNRLLNEALKNKAMLTEVLKKKDEVREEIGVELGFDEMKKKYGENIIKQGHLNNMFKKLKREVKEMKRNNKSLSDQLEALQPRPVNSLMEQEENPWTRRFNNNNNNYNGDNNNSSNGNMRFGIGTKNRSGRQKRR